MKSKVITKLLNVLVEAAVGDTKTTIVILEKVKKLSTKIGFVNHRVAYYFIFIAYTFIKTLLFPLLQEFLSCFQYF